MSILYLGLKPAQLRRFFDDLASVLAIPNEGKDRKYGRDDI
jgi:hypothetical protein